MKVVGRASFLGASCSLAADRGNAGTDHTEEGAAAGDAHADPGDEVVDGHEVSGGDLVEAGLAVKLTLLPSVIFSSTRFDASGGYVTGGVLTVLLESPDHTEDPPEEATAAHTAATKTHEALAEGSAEEGEETGSDDGEDGEELGPEAPREPGNELAVHVSDIKSVGSEALSSWLELLDTSLNTVPGGQVGVAVGVLAEVADKGEVSSAHGEGADASAHLSAGASVGDLVHIFVRHCSNLFFSNN